MHIFKLEKMWALMQQRAAQIFFCWIRDFGLTSGILTHFCTSAAWKIGKKIYGSELCELAVLWNRQFCTSALAGMMVSYFYFSNWIKQRKAETLSRGAVQENDLVRAVLNTSEASAAAWLFCKLLDGRSRWALYAGKMSLHKSVFSLYVTWKYFWQ